MPKIVKWGPLKNLKMKGRPFGDIKKISKKVSQSQKTIKRWTFWSRPVLQIREKVPAEAGTRTYDCWLP